MNRTVRQYDARTNTTYVYEVIESHYDSDKKQTRSTRKLIGKLDQDGNVIPTGSRGHPKGKTQSESSEKIDAATQHYKDLLRDKDMVIQQKENYISELSGKLKKAERTIQKYRAAAKATERIWAALE